MLKWWRAEFRQQFRFGVSPFDGFGMRVFRAFYHFSRAVQQGESDNLVEFLCTHAKLLGLIKRWRSRHRDRQQQEQLVWNTA